MPYFQNVFDQEFRGNWILGDRQYTLNFNLRGNLNTSTLMMCFTPGPYDFSTNNTLTINYAIDPTLKQFQTLAINVSGAIPAITQAWEVANALNANPIFAGLWTALTRSYNNTITDPNGQGQIVYLQSNRPSTAIKAYISNTGAEEEMTFNANAPISQLPIYFNRHSIPSILTFPDSLGVLLPLDTTNAYIQSIIKLQGQDPNTITPDWQLLAGRSGLFLFKSYTYDVSSRITQVLEYHAGAIVGDLSMLIKYQYTGASTLPSIVTNEPYILTSGDLVVPD